MFLPMKFNKNYLIQEIAAILNKIKKTYYNFIIKYLSLLITNLTFINSEEFSLKKQLKIKIYFVFNSKKIKTIMGKKKKFFLYHDRK